MPSKKQLRKKIKRLKEECQRLNDKADYCQRNYDYMFEKRRQLSARLAQYEPQGVTPHIRLKNLCCEWHCPCVLVPEYRQEESTKNADAQGEREHTFTFKEDWRQSLSDEEFQKLDDKAKHSIGWWE